jgi:hypothetical protein
MTEEEFKELEPGDKIRYVGRNKSIVSIQEKNGEYLTVGRFWGFTSCVNSTCVLLCDKICVIETEEIDWYYFVPSELEEPARPWSYERDY